MQQHNYIARYAKPGGGYRYLYPGDERGKFLHQAHERLKTRIERGEAPPGTSAKEAQQALAEHRKHVEEHLDNEHEKNKKAFQLFHDILHKKKDADLSSLTKEEWERAHRHTFSHEDKWEGPVSAFKKMHVRKAMDSIDQLEELSKAGPRGGAYYRRVATGNPKRPWKYYYSKAAYEKAHGKEAHVNGEEAKTDKKVSEKRAGVWQVEHAPGAEFRSKELARKAASKTPAEAYTIALAQNTLATGDKLIEYVLPVKAVNNFPLTPEEKDYSERIVETRQKQIKAKKKVKDSINDWYMKEARKIPSTVGYRDRIRMEQYAREGQFDPLIDKGIISKKLANEAAGGKYKESKVKSDANMDPIDQLEKAAKKKTPHPVSEAQRRWAFAAEERGELPKGKAREWSRRVKGQKLPESKATTEMLSDIVAKRTPGIRRALRALAETKRQNVARVARGEAPIVEGEKVSLETFSRRTGAPGSKKEAKERLAAKMIDAIDLIGKFAEFVKKEEKEKPDEKGDKKNGKPPFGKKPGDKDQQGKPQQNGKPPEPGDKREYQTKVENPEKPGEYTFEMLSEDERPDDARFVVSDETPEGAHWEAPHHSEHYDHFKQWKAARKQGLKGTEIPEELVQGAMKHAEKHHFDAGPHKAAYDDHLEHQNANGAPKPPPSHHTVKNGNGSHPAMRSKDENGKGKPPMKPGEKPEGKPDDKKPMVGKMQVTRSIPDEEMKDVRQYGVARSGTERPTVGTRAREIENTYQDIYGYMKRKMSACKSGDAIDQLETLSKAGPYIGPKGGKWANPQHTIPWDEQGEKRKKKRTTLNKKADKVFGSKPVSAEHADIRRMVLERLGGHEPDKIIDDEISFLKTKLKDTFEYHHEPSEGGWIKVSGGKELIAEDRALLVALKKDKEHLAKLAKKSKQQTRQKKSEAGEPMYQQDGDTMKLTKGVYSYDDHDGKAKDLPDAFLFEYLAGFVKEAINSYDCRDRLKALTANEDIHMRAAQEAMQLLVRQMPKDKNLTRASKKYKVTQQSIADIIKQRNFIATPSDAKPSGRDYDPASSYFNTDWDSMTSMGVTGDTSPTGEVMMASQDNPWAQGAPGVKLTNEPEHRSVESVPGNPLVNMGELHKSKVNVLYPDQPVVPNVNNDCVIHGTRDLTKEQNFQNPEGVCTCDKK
jgi:hypothetical protein